MRASEGGHGCLGFFPLIYILGFLGSLRSERDELKWMKGLVGLRFLMYFAEEDEGFSVY